MGDKNSRSSLDPSFTQNRLLSGIGRRVSTTEAQGATESPQISLSLYSQLLAVTQIIKTNHTKLDPSRSFCPQPTSWVLGMGLEWEAGGVANATGRK